MINIVVIKKRLFNEWAFFIEEKHVRITEKGIQALSQTFCE